MIKPGFEKQAPYDQNVLPMFYPGREDGPWEILKGLCPVGFRRRNCRTIVGRVTLFAKNGCSDHEPPKKVAIIKF